MALPRSSTIIVLLCLVLAACTGSAPEDAYYRGVYESCLRARSKEGIYTLYDMQVCKGVETVAREEGWYSTQLSMP